MEGGAATVETVIAALSGGDALGLTADEIAAHLGLPAGGKVLQHELEDMVWQGLLERHGVGRGALYALTPSTVPAKEPATGSAAPSAPLKGPLAQKAG
jgi:hypothetical protein